MKRFFIVITILGLVFLAFANNYTLSDCLEIAYRNNLELRAKQEDLLKFERKVSEAYSNVYPTISLQSGIGYIIEPEFTSVTVEDPTVPPEHLPPGMRAANTMLVPYPDFGFQHSLSIQQILFSSQAFIGISLAKRQRKVERLNYEILGRQIRNNIEKAFYNILITEEIVNIRHKAWSQDSVRLDMVRKKFDQGLVSEFNLLRSEVQIKNSVAELNNSRLMHRMAKLYMFFLLDKEYDEDANFIGQFREPSLLPNISDALDLAKDNRLEYEMMDETLSIFKSLIRLNQASYLPNVVAQGSFNLFYGSDELGDFTAFDDFGKDYSIGVGLQWTLFDGLRRNSKVDQARIDHKKMEITKKQLDAGIEMEIRQALWQLEQYMMDYESALSSLGEAAKLIEIANVQYEEGLVTFVELNDAQLAYDATQLNYKRALFNYSVAMSDYNKAVGK